MDSKRNTLVAMVLVGGLYAGLAHAQDADVH